MKADSNLHRAGKRPDWSKVSRRRWSIWQRLAGNSGGVVTIGNLLTVAGFCLVLVGLSMIISEMYWPGLLFIFVGRLFDLLDGWFADQTKTKSPLGELLDSTADKLGTAAALAVLLLLGLVPWLVVALIFVPQLALAVFSLFKGYSNQRLHPSRLGKLGMAAAWLSLVLFIVQAATVASTTGHGSGSVDTLSVAGYAAAVLSAVLSLAALAGYRRIKYDDSEQHTSLPD